MRWWLVCGVVALLFAASSPQVLALDTVRVCTYNVLKFSAANEDGRIPQFAAIMEQIRPDILLCQEVEDATLGARFVTEVCTWAPFAAPPFIDGDDSDPQIVYNQNVFEFLNQRRIQTNLRNIGEYTLATKPTNGLPPDTVVFYVVHLKASDGSAEAQQRAGEIDQLLANKQNVRFTVVAGDFNIYSPNEPAYTRLLSNNFVDPLGTSWQRNIAGNAGLYTQSTRASQDGSCGGGVGGGIDDRFDFIMVSSELASRVVPGTYTVYGNDGTARLNSSINDPENTSVTTELADALYCASDHLPVYVDVVLGDVQASVQQHNEGSFSARYEASNIYFDRCTVGSTVSVHDSSGRVVLELKAASTQFRTSASALATGYYLVHHDGKSSWVYVHR